MYLIAPTGSRRGVDRILMASVADRVRGKMRMCQDLVACYCRFVSTGAGPALRACELEEFNPLCCTLRTQLHEEGCNVLLTACTCSWNRTTPSAYRDFPAEGGRTDTGTTSLPESREAGAILAVLCETASGLSNSRRARHSRHSRHSVWR